MPIARRTRTISPTSSARASSATRGSTIFSKPVAARSRAVRSLSLRTPDRGDDDDDRIGRHIRVPLLSGMTMSKPDMLLGPVIDRSAWKGADMMNDDSWIYRLSEREAAEIESAFARAMATGKGHENITPEDFPLETLGRLVTAMRDQIEDGRGVTLLKGVPIAGKTVDEAEVLYAGISAHIGTSVAQDTEGTLIGRVEDLGNNYQDIKVRGTNTNAQLTPHCDSADILALLCVRQAKTGGMNTLASSMAIYNEILAQHEEFLEPLYNGF